MFKYLNYLLCGIYLTERQRFSTRGSFHVGRLNLHQQEPRKENTALTRCFRSLGKAEDPMSCLNRFKAQWYRAYESLERSWNTVLPDDDDDDNDGERCLTRHLKFSCWRPVEILIHSFSEPLWVWAESS